MTRALRLKLVFGLWLFGIFAYWIPATTWNPISRFALTRSIVERRALDIDPWADWTGDRALRDGHWYTEKAPIPAFLAVPAYAAYRAIAPDSDTAKARNAAESAGGLYVASLSTAALAGVALGLLLFGIARRRGASERVALGAATFAVLGSPLFPYATSFYGHTVAAAFLVAGASLALEEESPSRRRLQLAGACLVLGLGSEYLVALPVFAVVVLLLRRAGKSAGRSGVLWCIHDLALGGLLPALAIGAYHTACFGTPWRTGYSFIVNPKFAGGHASGFLGIHLPNPIALWGMLAGSERGLFRIAPVLLVATIAWIWLMYRKREPFVLATGIVSAVLVLANSGYYMWWGGASAGPRHIVPIMGFAVFGLVSSLSHVRARIAAVALGLVSVFDMLAITAAGIEAPEKGDLLYEWAWPAIREGNVSLLMGASNLGMVLGNSRAASLGPLFLWIIAGVWLLWSWSE